MSARQNDWAKRARWQLVLQLGGRCVRCGCVKPNRLELDHKLALGWRAERISSSGRIAWYRRALAEGNLQVLCRDCNKAKEAEDMEHLRKQA